MQRKNIKATIEIWAWAATGPRSKPSAMIGLLLVGHGGGASATRAMAHSGKLDAGLFQDLLRRNQLTGTIGVFSGDYPSLLPEQVQGFKIGRFQSIAVAICIVSSTEGKGPTYWLAALAYE